MSVQDQAVRKGTRRVGGGTILWFAVWAVLLVIAGVYGTKLQSVMTRGTLMIPGSESAQVRDLTAAEFPNNTENQLVLVFNSDSFTVDDPEYRDLVGDVLEDIRDVDAVTSITTPWDAGLGDLLMGDDDHSIAVLLDITPPEGEALDTAVVPQLKAVTKEAPDGIQVYLTGDAAANYDLFDQILEDVAVAERFVIPIILVILMVIFGSVVAAAIPAVLGIISVAVSMGLFYFYAKNYPVYDVATALISMMGMGVGVDYALFLVTRFREELAAGRDPDEAARRTVATSGRAILFSGATVVVSVLSLFIVRTSVIRSLAVAMAVVVLVAVGAAETLLPQILRLLGPKINALRLPLQTSSPGAEHGWRRWAMQIMRRPILFTALSVIPLALLAAPALRMSFGMPNISLLEDTAESRQGYNILEEQFSPGLLAMVEVTVTVPEGTVADADNIAKVYDAVEAIKEDPGVDSVVSYVSLDPSWTLDDYEDLYVNGVQKLADLPDLSGLSGLSGLTSQLFGGASGLTQAAYVLNEVQTGLLTLQDNMYKLSGGSEDMAQGAAQAREGLGKIRTGLQQAEAQVEAGAGQYQQLADGLNMAQDQLDQAISGLDDMIITTKLLDQSNYRDVYTAVMTARMVLAGGSEEGPSMAESVEQGAASLQQLAAGIGQIDASLGQVEEALDAIASGAQASSSGQQQVAEALGQAASGLGVLSSKVAGAGDALSGAGIDIGDLDLSDFDFDLSNFALAADIDPSEVLSKSDLSLRMVQAAGGEMFSTLVNLDHGANIARLMVIPKTGPDEQETTDTIHRLRDTLHANFAELDPKVGGYVAMLADSNDHMAWALPRVIALALAITFVVLMILLRSVLLPLIAVILNTCSVCASYGVLVKIFQDGFLSGALRFTPLYYLESPVVVMLFAVLFGLSMDYQVFLLSRVKEAWDATQNNEESVAFGVAKTAGIITGAATIMVLIFVTFGLTGMLTIKEMAFGLAVAIFLDASVVRLMLAPALMRLPGKWNWWAPAWLQRLLPNLHIEH